MSLKHDTGLVGWTYYSPRTQIAYGGWNHSTICETIMTIGADWWEHVRPAYRVFEEVTNECYYIILPYVVSRRFPCRSRRIWLLISHACASVLSWCWLHGSVMVKIETLPISIYCTRSKTENYQVLAQLLLLYSGSSIDTRIAVSMMIRIYDYTESWTSNK